jgi:SAM-dependent methyltransferase
MAISEAITGRDAMVERQLRRRGILDERVLAAFRAVPRELFVSTGMEEFAYEDTALPIDEGQTISQPYVVALMAQALEIRPTDRVLEVGAGSGYAAAILSRLADRVYAIERHPRLAELAKARIEPATGRAAGLKPPRSTRSWCRPAGRRCPRPFSSSLRPVDGSSFRSVDIASSSCSASSGSATSTEPRTLDRSRSCR